MVMGSISPFYRYDDTTYGEKVLNDICQMYEMGILNDLEASRAHGRMSRRINAFLLKVRDGIDINNYEECGK